MGDARSPGELVQWDAEIPILVQTGGQVAQKLLGRLIQIELLDLAEEKIGEGFLQTAIRPHLGQRVQFLGVQALVIAILTVAVLQPLHTAKELLIPGSFLLGAGRLQIDDRVLLGELLNISLQFHCAHLKEREALERLLGELLSLPLDQFHKGRLLFQSYYSKYAKGKQDRHKA